MKRKVKNIEQAQVATQVIDKPVEVIETDSIKALRERLAVTQQIQAEINSAIAKEAEAEKQRQTEVQRKADEEKARLASRAEPIGTALPNWQKPEVRKSKTGLTLCTIIADSIWYEGQKVDLSGADVAKSEWTYYGTRRPVLVKMGKLLMPYEHSDVIGDSAARLYKGANPEGWKGTWTHRSQMLEKIKVGLMVALVLGVMFLIYILINQAGQTPETAMHLMEAI